MVQFSAEFAEDDRLGLSWPTGVISLSHVALPVSPDDPLYGRRPPEDEDVLFLGEMAMRGERGLLSLAFHPEYSQTGHFFVNYTDGNGRFFEGEYYLFKLRLLYLSSAIT